MPDSLRDYTQLKLALADQLRIACDAMSALGLEKSADELQELMIKLAEDRFTLAVLGQFKRGKSSLMNAIIGRQLLPVGVLPLTSVITTLRYGPSERLLIEKKGFSFLKELPITALKDYVTENGNPGNEMGIETACVEIPVPFLRRGLEFVDTPGIGSAIVENTEQTYNFLPKCDAAIFVTGADTPLTSLELNFLQDVRAYAEKIFFVVNKIDLVTDAEGEEITNFIATNIKKQTGQDEIKLFSVSARIGLEARLSNDDARYEQSGIRELENALATFLSTEKARVFLTTISKKALHVIGAEAERGAFAEDALHAWEMRIQKKDFVMLKRNPHASAAAIAEAAEKIQVVYESSLTGTTEYIEKVQEAVPVKQMETLVEAKSDLPDSGEIAANLKISSCPVCRHLTDRLREFFALFQYEIATNENSQKDFAYGRGFCSLHTWQLLSMCSQHGASIGFAKVSERVAFLLRSTKIKGIGDLVQNSKGCRVCEMLRKEEKRYISLLAELLKQSNYKEHYGNSQGVCLRHLAMLIEADPEAELSEYLISHSARRFDEDAEDMRSFALKYDARRRYLQNTEETNAYRRAIIRLVGGRDLCTPWREDGEI